MQEPWQEIQIFSLILTDNMNPGEHYKHKVGLEGRHWIQFWSQYCNKYLLLNPNTKFIFYKFNVFRQFVYELHSKQNYLHFKHTPKLEFK